MCIWQIKNEDKKRSNWENWKVTYLEPSKKKQSRIRWAQDKGTAFKYKHTNQGTDRAWRLILILRKWRLRTGKWIDTKCSKTCFVWKKWKKQIEKEKKCYENRGKEREDSSRDLEREKEEGEKGGKEK